MSRTDKVAWACVALCLLLALTLRPLVEAVGSRELLLTTALFRAGLLGKHGEPDARRADEGLPDPWGRPWRFRPQPADPDPRADPLTWRWGYYSAGPDGVDDAGRGDDAWPHAMPMTHPECRALAWSREGLALLAFALAWFLVHPWRRAARSTAACEAGRAALIALPPTLAALVVAAWAAEWLGGHAGQAAGAAAERTSVPAPLALALTCWAVLFFLSLALRLRTRRADEVDESTPPIAPGPPG